MRRLARRLRVVLDGGAIERFDVVFGADDYWSLVRSLVDPGSALRDAGYIIWRGNSPEAELSPTPTKVD